MSLHEGHRAATGPGVSLRASLAAIPGVDGAEVRGLSLVKVDDFESTPGKGVKGTVDGKALALGNTALFEQEGIDISALRQPAAALREKGQTAMFVAV